MPKVPEYILKLKCADKPGIVAAIGGALAAPGCNIEDSQQFGDVDTGDFFMRVRFSSPPELTADDVRGALAPVAKRFSMDWDMFESGVKTRALVMVSKFDHCLHDLLYRERIGALPFEITRVVSNHDHARTIVDQAGHRYNHLPLTPSNKPEQEAALAQLVEDDGAELIILARYMQVLSDKFCAAFPGRIINIHHSFLPSFKGARPYHQARQRGVKLIGATAHYVTPDLDEGPIIEQETERVDHAMTERDLIATGRDIERRVLARAVKFHCEHRVLINGASTVVFR